MSEIKYWINRPRNDVNRDWFYDTSDWISDYIESVSHPHRQIILDELLKIEFESLLELGCSAGPNLLIIQSKFPNVKLAGIDANLDSLKEAEKIVIADLREGDMRKLPWDSKSFDVVLADASLMYISDIDIYKMINSIDDVVKRAIIIVDRFNESEKGEKRYNIWQRNYSSLLEQFGYKVTSIKLDENSWPDSKGWQEFGYVWVAKK